VQNSVQRNGFVKKMERIWNRPESSLHFCFHFSIISQVAGMCDSASQAKQNLRRIQRTRAERERERGNIVIWRRMTHLKPQWQRTTFSERISEYTAYTQPGAGHHFTFGLSAVFVRKRACVCLRKKIRGSEMGDKEIVPATKDLAMNSR
jgi:hypothetical protein